MYFYSMQFRYLYTSLKCALRKCQSVTVKIVTLQLLLHQVAGVRVCHFFVLFCLCPSWGGTRWNGTKISRDGTSLMEISCQHSVVVTKIESWGLLY